jgi:hypothetical protein
MGYHTTYSGQLKISDNVTRLALKRLKEILGKDVRNLPGLAKYKKDYWFHVDLILDEDEEGNLVIAWDDNSEKSSICPDMITAIIKYVNEVDGANFTLNGTLHAQGEEHGDTWTLRVVDNVATREEVAADTDRLTKLIKTIEDIIDNNIVPSRVEGLLQEALDEARK